MRNQRPRTQHPKQMIAAYVLQTTKDKLDRCSKQLGISSSQIIEEGLLCQLAKYEKRYYGGKKNYRKVGIFKP